MVQYFLRATFTVFEKQISIAYFSKVPNSVKVAHKKYTTYQEILILFQKHQTKIWQDHTGFACQSNLTSEPNFN